MHAQSQGAPSKVVGFKKQKSSNDLQSATIDAADVLLSEVWGGSSVLGLGKHGGKGSSTATDIDEDDEAIESPSKQELAVQVPLAMSPPTKKSKVPPKTSLRPVPPSCQVQHLRRHTEGGEHGTHTCNINEA